MQVFKGFSKSNKVKKHFIEGNKLTECLKMSLVWSVNVFVYNYANMIVEL